MILSYNNINWNLNFSIKFLLYHIFYRYNKLFKFYILQSFFRCNNSSLLLLMFLLFWNRLQLIRIFIFIFTILTRTIVPFLWMTFWRSMNFFFILILLIILVFLNFYKLFFLSFHFFLWLEIRNLQIAFFFNVFLPKFILNFVIN